MGAAATGSGQRTEITRRGVEQQPNRPTAPGHRRPTSDRGPIVGRAAIAVRGSLCGGRFRVEIRVLVAAIWMDCSTVLVVVVLDAALDVEAGNNSIEHLRQRPVGVADDEHERGHEHRADDQGVHQHRRGEAEAEHLDDHLTSEDERAKDEDHDRRRGRDRPPGRFQAPGNREPVIAGAMPLLIDSAHEKDLVVHREAEQDREHHHRDERLDRSGMVDAEQ